MTNEGRTNTEQVLFLLDKFGAGDAFYHKLTVTVTSLPKSYLLK